jgi:hypothetical protein
LLHQVSDLFELNLKLRCQKVKTDKANSNPGTSFVDPPFLIQIFIYANVSRTTVLLGLKGKGKGIVHSRTGHEGPKGE